MHLSEHVDEFNRQGFTVIRGAMSEEQADLIRAGVLSAFEGPEDGYGANIRTKMFEKGKPFVELIGQPVVADFAEEVLGGNCHMFSMNSLLTPKGSGIDVWHVDEELFFPLPDDVELDPRIPMPTFLFTCLYYLVDVEANMGPTQLVPGSHRSGQEPAPKQNPPIYKGQEPVSITAQKGDCLIFTGQTWHRGAKNESDKPRVVQQVTYSRRWVSQRFYPFVNYRMPDEVVAWAEGNRRLTRMLGFHPRGPYG